MRRLLVVDDEPVVADTLTAIFRKRGFDVRTAYTADDAMQLARQTAPDLLLCDIGMPVRDGLELMSDFSSELPACPIVVLTGLYHALKRIREAATKLPQPVTILTKPCEPDDLLREVTTMLRMA